MIQLTELHLFYTQEIKNYKEQCKHLKVLKKDLIKYKNKILKNEYFLINYTNFVSLEELEKADNFELIFKEELPLSSKKSLEKDLIDMITGYFKAYKQVEEEKEYVIDVINITKQQFNFILKTFNEKLVEKMIFEGKQYYFPNVGKIAVINQPRKKLTPNWEVSNKNKEDIIARGGIPYKVIDYDEENQPISNGGEKWLVYHENDNHPYFKLIPYIKKEEQLTYKKGMTDFIRFIPAKGNNSIIKKLNIAVRNDSTLLTLYP
jgi:hypothetical protein